jgi:hypothetical protein
MIFLVIKPTISKLILPENNTCSEKSILWAVARIYSIASPKIESYRHPILVKRGRYISSFNLHVLYFFLNGLPRLAKLAPLD